LRGSGISTVAATDPINENESLALVDGTASFALEVARGVVAGLELLLPHRRVERLIVSELPTLQARLRAAVEEVARVYSFLAALDVLRAPSFEGGMELQAIGAEIYGKIVRDPKAALPSVRGEHFAFNIAADPEAMEHYRVMLVDDPQPRRALELWREIQPPPPSASSAPAAFVARALRVWRGD
jgi:hypothetical protein